MNLMKLKQQRFMAENIPHFEALGTKDSATGCRAIESYGQKEKEHLMLFPSARNSQEGILIVWTRKPYHAHINTRGEEKDKERLCLSCLGQFPGSSH